MLYFALGLTVGWFVTSLIGSYVFFNEIVYDAYKEDLVRRYNHD